MKEFKSKNTEFHICKPKEERSFEIVFKDIYAPKNLDDTKKKLKI